MGAATICFWSQVPQVNKKLRTALTITGLLTAIACCYVRIFNSEDEEDSKKEDD